MRRVSAHLDGDFSSGETFDDFRKTEGEPCEQSLIGGIANAEPNNHGTDMGLLSQGNEILVFRYQHSLRGNRLAPYLTILGIGKTEVGNVPGMVTLRNEPASQGGR